MAHSQPCLPPQLAPEQSLCSAIADLWSISAIPFDDPFSADLALFTEEYVDDGTTPSQLSSFADVADPGPSPIVFSLPTTSASQDSKIPGVEHVASTHKVFPLKHSTRTSSEVSLAGTTGTGSSSNFFTAPAIAHAPHDANSDSCSESDTEKLSDAPEGTSSLPKRVGTAPRSRWTTQERSLFLATLHTLANTLDSSHSSSANDTDSRNLAETVSLVVATRSVQEVRSHARRALRKLRTRHETKSDSMSIKTLLCIVGSSENTSSERC